MSLSTPVAFLIFNCPDLTERVFEVIAKVKPKQLFVVADGPRNPGEAKLCNAARGIVNKVTWDCEVHTNFVEYNSPSLRWGVVSLCVRFDQAAIRADPSDTARPHPPYDDAMARNQIPSRIATHRTPNRLRGLKEGFQVVENYGRLAQFKKCSFD